MSSLLWASPEPPDKTFPRMISPFPSVIECEHPGDPDILVVAANASARRSGGMFDNWIDRQEWCCRYRARAQAALWAFALCFVNVWVTTDATTRLTGVSWNRPACESTRQQAFLQEWGILHNDPFWWPSAKSEPWDFKLSVLVMRKLGSETILANLELNLFQVYKGIFHSYK